MSNYIRGMRSIFAALVLTIMGCSTAVPSPEPTTVVGIPDSTPPRTPKTIIHCDSEFTEAERAELNSAAELWRLQTSGLAVVYLVWDVDFTSVMDIQAHVDANQNIMLRLESWMDLVTQEDEANGALLLGVVSPSGGLHNPWAKPLTIGFVVDRMGGPEMPLRATLTQVALHEFGHVFGVPHQAAINAIMFPSAIKTQTVCLKKPDLSAFCGVNECGTTKMYPCE